MDPFSIAALVAMLGGTALQYKASTDAQERQRRQIADSQARQRQFQMQAEKKAMDRAQEFTTEGRQKERQQIEEEITADLAEPVMAAQEINNQTSTTQGDVSKDYEAAKAAANLNQLKSAEALARLLGRTTSATRLRQNEAIRLADTEGDIRRLGSFARGQINADEIGIQQAGIPDAGLQLAGGLASALGGAALMGGSEGTIGKLFGGKAKVTLPPATQPIPTFTATKPLPPIRDFFFTT